VLSKAKTLGEMMLATHELWDLEAFGREVKRRKVLERLYRKLHRLRRVEGIELALNPADIFEFIYSRAADGYPYAWREPSL
jgi:hypothetical protein